MTLEATKADELAQAIEQAIVTGEIAPGTVLRQEQLSEQYAVSRTPVREALRRLAALGLVSFEPNRGVRVRTLSREDLEEAFLVRAELESLATELATPRFTDADFEELRLAEARFAEMTERLTGGRTEDLDERRALTAEWVRANHAFHDVIYRVADAPMVERIAKSARRTFSGHAVWGPGGSDIDDLYEHNVLQHRAIREALVAGSAAGARALARDHVFHSFHLLETVLAQAGQPQLRRLA
ncbi:MAG: GntR family transcriptional regulator [Pseudomonadota bacterium]